MKKILKGLWRGIYQEYKRRELNLYSTQITYYALLSLIPILVVLVSIFEIFGTSISSVLIHLTELLPIDIITLISIISKGVSRTQSLSFGTVGFVLALWFLSRTIYMVIRGLNKAFHTKENRKGLKIWVTAFTILILIILIIFSGFVIFGIGNLVLKLVESYVAFPLVFQRSLFVLGLLIGAGVIILSVNTIYYIAPNKKVEFKNAFRGAVVFGILWFILTFILRLIFIYFNEVGEIFGFLGLIIVFMVYINISSLLFLLCGELNYHWGI